MWYKVWSKLLCRFKPTYCGSVSSEKVAKSVANSVKKYRQTYLKLEKYDTKSQPTTKNLAHPDFVQKYLHKLSETS